MKAKFKPVSIISYNRGNLGDDLMVKIVAERYVNQFIAISTDQALRNMGVKTYVPEAINKIASILNTIIGVIGPRNLLVSIYKRKTNLLVYLGGSIFIENNNLTKWQKELLFLKKLRKPYYIIGSNIGPYRNSEFLHILSKIFDGAKDVCLRDKKSYSILQKNKRVRLASDIVFTLQEEKYNPNTHGDVIISIMDMSKHVSEIESEKYTNKIIAITKKLSKTYERITFMSFCKYEGDEAACMEVYDKLPKYLQNRVSIYCYTGDLDEALSIIASAKLIVASRFHATILGLLFKKKVLPIIYSDKTKNILDDMKFDGPVVEINNLDAFDVESFDPAKLKVFNVDKQIKLAEKQFQELDKVLVRRDSHE